MRLLVFTLIALFVWLQYEFWFGHGSVISAWKLKDHISTIEQTNTELQQRNAAIAADIKDLKSGNQAIEERARGEMGMVKKGEVFYQIVKYDKHKK